MMDEKGQVSAEILMVLVAVIAVAILLLTQLKTTGLKAESALESNSTNALSRAKSIK
ncbi:MAG: hypothetical protein JXA43_02140 [Candidatus Diapherotrites archaeon]|nr:hypothetical protein [Candidatus Diapherotrites archaeon]